MKRFNLLFLAVVVSMFLALWSCTEDTVTVNEDGLTEDIVNLVPDSILNEMKNLGMPIYGGNTPPNIENSFLASPFVLKASNREGDQPGHTYVDLYFRFYDQDNKHLTVSISYVNGPESGEGLGGYLVGEDNAFSAFMDIDVKADDGSKAKIVVVISGVLTDDGIKDLYYANFMVDNFGNSTGYWIENGEGRVIYDSDGFSPTVDFPDLKSGSTRKGISAK